MSYEVVQLEEMLIVGIGVKTTNEDGKCAEDIGGVWHKLISEDILTHLTAPKTGKGIGLYTDYEGDYTKPYYFLAGYEVTSLSENDKTLVVKKIPAGKYAKFSTRGHMQEAVATLWHSIWSLELDRTYTGDFEVYHHNSDDMNDQCIDVYIAIN